MLEAVLQSDLVDMFRQADPEKRDGRATAVVYNYELFSDRLASLLWHFVIADTHKSAITTLEVNDGESVSSHQQC